MKIRKFMLLFAMGLMIMGQKSASAESEEGVIEVLRGEETEVELELKETEDIYALYGVLSTDGAYVSVLRAEKRFENSYQAMAVDADGRQGKLLLSRLGKAYQERLHLTVRVKGIRIGTTTIHLTDSNYVSAQGQWINKQTFPKITVKVLPNPLEVKVTGQEGNNGWYKGKTTVTVKDVDAKEIVYTVNGGPANMYGGAFSMEDGTWLLTVTTDDGYGYKKEESRTILVDTKKPVLMPSFGTCDWRKDNLVLQIKAMDDTSGVARVSWWVSNDAEEKSGPENTAEVCEIAEDGIWYLHMYAQDNAGHETESVFGPYKRDSVAPEIGIKNISSGQGFTDAVLPEVEFEDFSGIQNVEYSLDGAAWELSEITGKGMHTLTVAATDLAGNRAEQTVTFFIYDSLDITCMAEDTHYTGMGSFLAEVRYQETPLTERDVEFYVNGEWIGTVPTDKNGRAVLWYPVDLQPQEATVTAVVAQDEENYYAETESETTFTIAPETAVAIYTGDLVVKNGETLSMRVEMEELPDLRPGDVTKALLAVKLSFLEEDGSRTVMEEWLLAPEENGIFSWNGTYKTGLYELTVTFADGSCYDGNELKLYPAVYDVQAVWDDGAGKLVIDLPQVGLKLTAKLAFLPSPDLSAEVALRIPGTGTVLTVNALEGWKLAEDGMVLEGMACNPKTGEVYCYQMKAEFDYGLIITGLEAYVWAGEEPGSTKDDETVPEEERPLYRFLWRLEDWI